MTVKRGVVDFLLYLPLHGFCIDMLEDGLITGQNM